MTALESGRTLLQRIVAPSAVGRFAFFRDESDSFAFGSEACNGSELAFGRSDVAQFLPAGSQWRIALNWRSFIGKRLIIGQQILYGLAVQAVSSHPSRGAFPEAYGYLIRAGRSASECMNRLAAALETKEFEAPAHGVVLSNATCWEEHRRVEVAILMRAFENEQFDKPMFFNTGLLSEQQASMFAVFLGTLRPEKRLAGSINQLSQHFSKRIRLLLKLSVAR